MVRFKRLHLVLYMLYKCLHIAIPDVQNSFHKALAVIFAEVQYLYFRRNPSASSIGKLNVCGSYAQFNFFPYKLPLNKNVNTLHLLVRHKYLHEDHSMAQTVVSLSSSYTELFWKTSCFFQKGQSSGIATTYYVTMVICTKDILKFLNLGEGGKGII